MANRKLGPVEGQVCWFCKQPSDDNSWMGLGILRCTSQPMFEDKYILYHEACAVYSCGAGDVPPQGMDDASVLKFWRHGEKASGIGLKCQLCGKRGATTGCLHGPCQQFYHYPCARVRALQGHLTFSLQSRCLACRDHVKMLPHPHEKDFLGMWMEGAGSWNGTLMREAKLLWLPQYTSFRLQFQQQWQHLMTMTPAEDIKALKEAAKTHRKSAKAKKAAPTKEDPDFRLKGGSGYKLRKNLMQQAHAAGRLSSVEAEALLGTSSATKAAAAAAAAAAGSEDPYWQLPPQMPRPLGVPDDIAAAAAAAGDRSRFGGTSSDGGGRADSGDLLHSPSGSGWTRQQQQHGMRLLPEGTHGFSLEEQLQVLQQRLGPQLEPTASQEQQQQQQQLEVGDVPNGHEKPMLDWSLLLAAAGFTPTEPSMLLPHPPKEEQQARHAQQQQQQQQHASSSRGLPAGGQAAAAASVQLDKTAAASIGAAAVAAAAAAVNAVGRSSSRIKSGLGVSASGSSSADSAPNAHHGTHPQHPAGPSGAKQQQQQVQSSREAGMSPSAAAAAAATNGGAQGNPQSSKGEGEGDPFRYARGVPVGPGGPEQQQQQQGGQCKVIDLNVLAHTGRKQLSLENIGHPPQQQQQPQQGGDDLLSSQSALQAVAAALQSASKGESGTIAGVPAEVLAGVPPEVLAAAAAAAAEAAVRMAPAAAGTPNTPAAPPAAAAAVLGRASPAAAAANTSPVAQTAMHSSPMQH